jgi:hypothetical protein
MKYYSVDVERELRPERLEIPPDLVGYHLRLQFACCLSENAGIVRNCRRWSETRWRHFAGLTKRTLRRLEARHLIRWVDDDLEVADFNSYGLIALQQRRMDGAKSAKLRWSGSRSPIGSPNGSPNAKDRSALGDPGADRSAGPKIAAAKPSSSSSIEVVEAGGGGLPDGVWEQIWAELPNRRGYWKKGARQAIEAVVVPTEVVAFLDFLNRAKQSRSWKASPPTPLTIASEFRDRRAPPAARKRAPQQPGPRVPSRAEIRATWASARGKESGS